MAIQVIQIRHSADLEGRARGVLQRGVSPTYNSPPVVSVWPNQVQQRIREQCSAVNYITHAKSETSDVYRSQLNNANTPRNASYYWSGFVERMLTLSRLSSWYLVCRRLLQLKHSLFITQLITHTQISNLPLTGHFPNCIMKSKCAFFDTRVYNKTY